MMMMMMMMGSGNKRVNSIASCSFNEKCEVEHCLFALISDWSHKKRDIDTVKCFKRHIYR